MGDPRRQNSQSEEADSQQHQVGEVVTLLTLAAAIRESLEEAEVKQLSFELTMMMKRAIFRCYDLADSEEVLGYSESAATYRELASELDGLIMWIVRGVARAKETAAS